MTNLLIYSYDYLEHDRDLTIAVDHAISVSVRPQWQNNPRRFPKVGTAIYNKLIQANMTRETAKKRAEEILEIAKRQEEYDRQ